MPPKLYVYRRAGAVVVDGDRVALVSMQLPGGRRWWLFPGGGIEPGESPEQAAVRELHEETGLRASSWRPYLRAGVHGGEHDYFLVECDDPTFGAVTGPELEYAADADFRADWVPIERLAAMPVFPRCVAEHLAEHGTDPVPHGAPTPWYEDDRGSWDGVPGADPPAHVRIAARVVVADGDHVAAIERVRDGHRYFTLPGGGVEEGETSEEAAVREAAEELGLHVVPTATHAVVAFQTDELTSLQTYFRCDIAGGTFGSGHGAEMTSSGSSPAGTYRPVWLDGRDLPDELRPTWLLDRLPAWLDGPVPDRPERFVEDHRD